MSTSRLARAWRAWVQLMDRREPATALALVRIGASLVLLAEFVFTYHAGQVELLWSTLPAGFAAGQGTWAASLGLGAFDLWAIATGALVCVLLGLATRVALVAFALVSAQLSMIAPDCESGMDILMRIVFLVLALSRCNARWSLDAWVARRLGRPMPELVPAWPRYLLLMQLVWVYFSGGQNKASHNWGPLGGFSALGHALMDPIQGRLDPDTISAVYPLTRVATAVTITFELTALFYLLWLYYAATADRPGRLRAFANRARLRWIWFALFVAFEVGIVIGLRLGSFPFGMLALWPVLLLSTDVERLVNRITRIGARRAARDVSA